MLEYATREEAENDPMLNLKILYQCNKCKKEITEYPKFEVSACDCGGVYQKIGEIHDVI